jgi:hypothetical protein
MLLPDLPMTTAPRFAWFVFLLMFRSLPVHSQATDDPVGMVRKMHSIAGENVLDCGHVAPEADPKLSLKCARRAIEKNQTFVVRYDGNGIEGPLFTGFAGDGRGDVYWLHVDSYTCQDPGRYPDKCPYVVKCPTPVHLLYYLDVKGEPYGYDCVDRLKKKPD